MSIRLVVTVPIQEGEDKQYDYVFQKEEITLGRHSRNDIQIPTPEVSAEHAKILVEGENLFLVDLGSQAGTALGGKPAEAQQRTPIGEGMEITIGGCTIRISRDVQEVTPATQEKTQQVAMKMVREVLGALGGSSGPYLEVMNDDEQGQVVRLEEEGAEVLAGRESDCALKLTHWSVSRHHARIRRTWEGVTVEDLKSKNGVMINEAVIRDAHQIKDGDLIFIGHTQVRFHDPSGTLIDQLDDIPTPVSIDIKTTIIDLEDKKAEKKPEPKPPAEPAAPPPAEAGKAEEAAPEPKKAKRKKAKVETIAAGAAPAEGAAADLHADVTGGLGDYLFVIIGILVILGVAAAAVFLFLL